MTIDDKYAKRLDEELRRGKISFREGIRMLSDKTVADQSAKLTRALEAIEAAKKAINALSATSSMPGEHMKFYTQGDIDKLRETLTDWDEALLKLEATS